MRPHWAALAAFQISISAAAQSEQQPSTLARVESASVLKQNAEAVTEGQAALEAFQSNEWKDAYQRFSRAESLAHSPVFLLYMARAQKQMGAWLAALEVYARVLKEPMAPSMPDSWRSAVDTARIERARLVEELPSIVVVLSPSSPAESTVTLDGAPLDRLGQELSVDPGVHHLVIRSSDGAEVRRSITVLEGRKRTRIELATPVSKVSRRAALSRSPVLARRTPAESPRTLAYVVGGAGLTSLVVGLVAGTLAWYELRQIKADCQGTRCDPRDANRLDSVHRLGTIADVGVALGAAGLGTSAILLWVVPGSRGAAAPVSGVMFGSALVLN